MSENENETPEYRKDLGLRTSWSSILGEIIELSVISKDLGMPVSTEAFEDGWLEGRVVGVDASGIWLESTDHTFEVAEKKRDISDLPHFFIPFSNIQSVESYPVRV